MQNAGFPYDSTTDQQLDQPQFESYRQLGFLAGQQAFEVARGEPTVHEKFEAVEGAFGERAWWPDDLVEVVRGLRGEPT
jgi:hypothetical protein